MRLTLILTLTLTLALTPNPNQVTMWGYVAELPLLSTTSLKEDAAL